MKNLPRIYLIVGFFFVLGSPLVICMETQEATIQIPAATMNRELMDAVYMEKEDVVDVLLRLGANPNTQLPNNENNGWTVLHYATVSGNLRIMNKLLKYNPDINAQSKNGATPLHLAVIERNKKMVKRLLKAGANPNLANKHNQTPIDQAILNNEVNLAQLMRGW